MDNIDSSAEKIINIIDIFLEYESVLIIFLENNIEYRINVKLDVSALDHLFGISSNYLGNKLLHLYKLKNNSYNIDAIIEKIKKDRKISKKNKAIIFEKIKSANAVFNKIFNKSIENFEIYKNLKFKNYSVDYCLKYEKHIVGLDINHKSKNDNHTFHNCHTRSIRTNGKLDKNNKIDHKNLKFGFIKKLNKTSSSIIKIENNLKNIAIK